MRTLLLMRHAKSDWGSEGLSDFARPLNKRGQKAARRMGRWLLDNNLTPDHTICSTACRAQETLLGLRETIQMSNRQISHEARGYLADLNTLLIMLAEAPETDLVLLIGHNPGMEELLTYLCGHNIPHTTSHTLMPTATLAQIALPDEWQRLQRGSGTLTTIIRPKELDQPGQ